MIKEEILSDAIKTALDYSLEIVRLKQIIAVMGFVIFALLIILATCLV